MIAETVECVSDVTVSVSGPMAHLCPFVDEVDQGEIVITWTPAGRTFELHSLRTYLAAWAGAQVSHEEITDRIQHDLGAAEGIGQVSVATTWETAGFDVRVRGNDD